MRVLAHSQLEGVSGMLTKTNDCVRGVFVVTHGATVSSARDGISRDRGPDVERVGRLRSAMSGGLTRAKRDTSFERRR